ncbi:MAG TPA: histidine kinase [Thermoanaerobaculia bacterium]|nr:histidine kinase [Thermoanaerobaculia bacterium]
MSRRVWLFAAGFWAFFGIISGVQVWISMITHGHSVPLLIGYHVIVWEGWLLPTAGILWLARRFPVLPPRRLNVLLHMLAASAIAVLHGVLWMGLLVTMRPYDSMTAEASELPVAQLLFARLPLEWTLYCLVLGAGIAYERTLRAMQLETSLAEARLHALELQIQPHFLFNTMNAISSLVRGRRNDEAVTMLAGLSELLRYTLDHAEQQRVSLEEELTVLRRYLEIQHIRFPDRMTFAIDAGDETKRAAVPALLLQPLAENAVRHGIDPSSGPGVVDVRAFRSGERLRIEIFNSGNVAAAPRIGIGLRNTRERLQHLYGAEWSFELTNAKGGVLASLSIPWSEVA